MRYKVMMTCESCGVPVSRANRADRHNYCIDCAAQAVVLSALSMAAKTGPVYDRWRQNPGGRPNDCPLPEGE